MRAVDPSAALCAAPFAAHPLLQAEGLQVDELPAARRCLRLAVVTETYPPEVNGVAGTVARVVQGLQARDHQVQLVRPRQAAAEDGGGPDGAARGPAVGLHEVLMRGLPIPRYPQLRMGMPCKGALVRLWSRRRPDLVHVATEGPLGWSALQAAAQLKLPVTSDFRTNFHAYSGHYGVGWLRKPILAYLRKFHNRCALTMVPTEGLRAELAAAGFKRLAVVARGVDLQQFAPEHRDQGLRARWGAAPDDLVMLCVGRLAAEKNLDLALQAYAQVRQRQPRARLLLVGDGPLAAALASHPAQPILAGQRRGADLAAHYASADLFVFPSLTETFGNVTAEAMASGLPVLAFDYAGAAQLVRTGQDGLLVPLADAPAFEAAALQLAARRPAERRAMGLAARERVLPHDWARVVARFEAQLSVALDRPAGPPAWPLSARPAA